MSTMFLAFFVNSKIYDVKSVFWIILKFIDNQANKKEKTNCNLGVNLFTKVNFLVIFKIEKFKKVKIIVIN